MKQEFYQGLAQRVRGLSEKAEGLPHMPRRRSARRRHSDGFVGSRALHQNEPGASLRECGARWRGGPASLRCADPLEIQSRGLEEIRRAA